MFRPFAMFFFILTVVWAGAIMVTTDPYARLHRAALPIALLGRATVAAVVQVEPEWAAPVYNFFLKTEHGFQYMLWSVFYEEEWRSLNGDQNKGAGAQQGNTAASAPAPAGSAAARGR